MSIEDLRELQSPIYDPYGAPPLQGGGVHERWKTGVKPCEKGSRQQVESELSFQSLLASISEGTGGRRGNRDSARGVQILTGDKFTGVLQFVVVSYES